MSFGSSKTKSNSKTHSEPWAPAIPGLKGVIDKALSVGNIDVTPDQMAAFEALKGSAAEGNPFTPKIANLADWSLDFDNTAQKDLVGDAFTGLQDNLGAFASGEFTDVLNNPQLREMIDVVGSDVQDRINRMFAGAGRDLSGANQTAVAKGVTAAQLPLLLNEFNRQQDRQIGAASTLFEGASQTAGQQSQLDQLLQQIRAGGIDLGEAALDAKNYAANTILDLDQQIQQLPYENLALLTSIIAPLAGLGGDSQTKGSSKTSGFSISDARKKTDLAPIGKLADGQTVWRFRYTDDPLGTVHIGLVAQEVEKVAPDAVIELGGVKRVHYGKATERAAQLADIRGW